MDSNRLIKEKYRVLSGSMLKVIAMLTMVIDHTAYVLIPEKSVILISVWGHSLTLYAVMRFIGRISFPIFAFLLVEGFLHTHNQKRYGIRLFVFALISEIPWKLINSGAWYKIKQNVFFTLLIGYLALCVIGQIEKAETSKLKYCLALVGLFALSVGFNADYGCAGFGFIIIMYLLRGVPFFRAIAGCCILPSHWKAGPAFILIALYNGKRGFIRNKPLQLLFYAIYPAHLLLLFFIKRSLA